MAGPIYCPLAKQGLVASSVGETEYHGGCAHVSEATLTRQVLVHCSRNGQQRTDLTTVTTTLSSKVVVGHE